MALGFNKETIDMGMNLVSTAAKQTAGSGVKGSGTNAGGKIAKGGNPYEFMYRENYGYIFGKPLAFHPRTDPNQRVFQKTMLRNNTIINIVPGIPWQDKELMAKAHEILETYNKEFERLTPKANTSSTDMKKLNTLATRCQQELINAGCDLRFAVFKQDITGFMTAYQLLLNRVGTAVFGLSSGGIARFVTENLAGLEVNESAATRGFKVWVEKGTSISESIDNQFMRSALEGAIKGASAIMKQAKFLGQAVGWSNSAMESTEVTSNDADAAQSGTIANIASRVTNGSNFDFPQMFDESKFNRSYEISFKFVSPYGDDRSVANHVLFPFLFLLTCSAPRQDGPNGHTSPFILQVDAPGFFSCPMGVVSSFSFRKGGDDMLFNDRGLPLVIEGSMSITDLYSNMSLPLTYSQFATNFGTSSFLNTLGGLNLYASMDMNLSDRSSNFLKDLIGKPMYLYNLVSEETYKLKRFFGVV